MPKENESFHSAWPSRILSYLKIVKGECNAKGKRKFSFGMAEPHPNLRKSIRILNMPLTQHEFKPFLKNNESFSLQYLSFQLPLPSKCYLQAECPTANTNRLANSLIALFFRIGLECIYIPAGHFLIILPADSRRLFLFSLYK